MSRVQITNEHGDANPVGPLSSYGTVVKIDGQEVRSVRSVQVTAGVDELLTAKLDVIVDDAVDIDVPADVQLRAIHVAECPSCGLQREKGRWPRVVAFHGWRSPVDLTHLQSPDRHRQKSVGERYASVEIRIPLWLADWWSDFIAKAQKPREARP